MQELERIENKEYYPNGVIKAQGDYIKRTIKIGIWIEYYENTQIKSLGYYGTNKFWGDGGGNKEGEWKEFYENGQLKRLGSYHDSTQPIGRWVVYYYNGQLKSTGIYRNGWSNQYGRWLYYHENGEIKKQEYYEKKMFSSGYYPHGTRKEFYDDGQLKSIEVYRNGKQIGNWFEYYQSGKIKAHADYNKKIKTEKQPGHNNFEHCVWWKFYNEIGTLISMEQFGKNWFESPYEGRGTRDGIYQSFYPNGKLKMEGVCSFNKKINEWKYYSSNGELLETVRTWLRTEEYITDLTG